jgi:Ca2+-binding RTX toxin-like protein
MANITGTGGNDTLTGTAADDIIKGLGGNDTITSSGGSDVIDGGAGYDTLDYTNLAPVIDIKFNQNGSLDIIKNDSSISDLSTIDNVSNIEKIVGSPNRTNSVRAVDTPGISFNVDLSKNRLTYFSQLFGTKTVTINNFTNIFGGEQNDILKGDDRDNSIVVGGGDNIVIGSRGNDSLGNDGLGNNNSDRNNTLDYSDIGQSVTILPFNFVIGTGPRGPNIIDNGASVDKGNFGQDRISGFNKIIGARGKENTIDASRTDNRFGSIDVNLAANLLNITIQKPVGFVENGSVRKYEIADFKNVIGGKFNDTIVGANKKGKLTGGGGSDTITGGNKNDVITGSDSTARGVGEVDTLTGGGGRDKFVLGDTNGAYYVGKGKDDYALITDFNLFQDSIDLGGFKNYSFASGGNNTIELYSGKDVNTRDLIAKIQLAGGISSARSNSRSFMGASQNIDSITSKIDIVSGSSSIADTV